MIGKGECLPAWRMGVEDFGVIRYTCGRCGCEVNSLGSVPNESVVLANGTWFAVCAWIGGVWQRCSKYFSNANSATADGYCGCDFGCTIGDVCSSEGNRNSCTFSDIDGFDRASATDGACRAPRGVA